MDSTSAIRFSLDFDIEALRFFEEFQRPLNCEVIETSSHFSLGNLQCEPVSILRLPTPAFQPVKRPLPSFKQKGSKKTKVEPSSSMSPPQISVSSFNPIELMPKLSDVDKRCPTCSHVASSKTNLKVHYKLVHLGGADLAVNCSLCQTRCTTKGNLKIHLMGKHKLSKENASKLLN